MSWKLEWVACGAAAALALGVPAPSEAATRKAPGNNTIAQCQQDLVLGGSNGDCEGPLCWCCYADGCWICGNSVSTANDCVWDGSYSATRVPLGARGGPDPMKRLRETRIPKERMSVDPGAAPAQQGDGSVTPTPLQRRILSR